MSEASFPVWFIRAQAGKEGFNKRQWHGVRYQDQSKGYTAPLVRVWEKEKLSSVESEAGWVRRAFLHRMSEVDKGEEGDPAKQPHQGTRVCTVKRAAWCGRCDSVIYNQFSHSVVCDSLRHHGLQHTRLPCPSPTLGACPNSCPSSWWCHPTILSSVVPLSSCLLSFLIGLFQWVSSSHQVAKVLELQLHHWTFHWILRTDFLYNWLVWSPCSPRDSQESSPAPQFKNINSLALNFLYGPTLTSIHDTGKTVTLTRWTFFGKVMSMLSGLVIAFLPRSKRLLISWLQSPSAVILEPKKRKSITVSIVFPSICHEVMGLDAMTLDF